MDYDCALKGAFYVTTIENSIAHVGAYFPARL